MMFNTLEFVVFATIFFTGWWLLRKTASVGWGWSYLASASLTFYAWWNWKHVVVLVAIVGASYGGGRAIARWPGRKSVLALAILAAIGPLLVFKYADFAIARLSSLLRLANIDLHVGGVGWAIPLGISFYSLSAVSYAIDVYTEEIQPSCHVLQHGVFLALFPLMMSGPIVRGAQLIPQLAELPVTTRETRWQGLKQITFGLVKKCLVADHIAMFTVQMYQQDPVPASSGLWWCVSILYAIQIYCDFSGYTDIALGLGRWMGFELPENFRHPFLSTSFREFWSRWNISFSSWLRDYIYFPMARRWEGTFGAAAAVILTFLVSGLWHGAAWTYVVFGLVFGVLIVVESWSKWDHHIKALPGGRYLAVVIVFLTISVVLVFFRAHDLAQARTIVKTMFSFESMEYSWLGRDRASFRDPTWIAFPILFVLVEARHLFDVDSSRLAVAIRKTGLGWIAIALLLLTCVYARASTAAFIYAGF